MLQGIPYACKDNFAVRGQITAAGCKLLNQFKPFYQAHVVTELAHQGAILCGKANLDELGMGGLGLYSCNGYVHNPYDFARIPGGSSSGCAGLVAAGIVAYALASDTGDSIRKPAAYNGVVGIKPTTGLLSRRGLFSYAPSFDNLGYLCRSISDAAILLQHTITHDSKDLTCQPIARDQIQFFSHLQPGLRGVKIAFIPGVIASLSPSYQKQFTKLLARLEQAGAKVTAVKISQNLLACLEPAYHVISFCEAASSNFNLDGINFGRREGGRNYKEIMTNTRTKNFGRVVKNRFIIGSYCLHRENQAEIFLKAQQIRTLVINTMKTLFQQYDVLLNPATEGPAPFIKDVEQQPLFCKTSHLNLAKNILLLANMYGNPSLAMPLTFLEGVPVGICLDSDRLQEQKLLNIARAIEELTGLENLSVVNKDHFSEYDAK